LRVGVIGGTYQETNPQLVSAWREAGIDAVLLAPEEARWRLGAGDVALIRLDVRDTLDGIEPGLRLLSGLPQRGIRVLNSPGALLAAHDKLITARRLSALGIPHASWQHVTSPESAIHLEPPFVVKPRFGSWGRDVFLCETAQELKGCLRAVAQKQWFIEHGALVEELAARAHHDLRLIVAGNRVVGAARRDAGPGEWRTNVSLGGSLTNEELDPFAVALGCRAASAIGIDLVGVDLLPLPGGGYVVLELNGAVDFDSRYSMGGDAYFDAAVALGLGPAAQVEMSATSAPESARRSAVRILTD
jgi:RimK family alpha-L-glutamate ligase